MVALSCHLQSIVCCDATATPRPMNLFISVCKLFVCMMPFKCIALKINFVYPLLLHVTLTCVHVLCNCKQSLHMWLCQLYVHYQVTWQYCLCCMGADAWRPVCDCSILYVWIEPCIGSLLHGGSFDNATTFHTLTYGCDNAREWIPRRP